MKKMILAAAAIAALGGALAACETATPYQPLQANAAASGGYSDVKLEQDRWRVTFQGNDLTARDTVENYLLYRAAELTVSQGYDWFVTVDRATDKHTQTYVDDFAFRPYWRYYGYGYGWRRWDPWFGGPFWADDIDVRTVEKYEASAEILMGHGPKPADKHAFDAREVMKNLASHVVRPKA
jgi:hypothetical protein